MTLRSHLRFIPTALSLAALSLAACAKVAEPGLATNFVVTTSSGVLMGDTAQKRGGVTVEAVTRMVISDQITAPGVLALDETRTARVGSLQEGLVLDIRAEVGRRVQSGQLLATMHGHAVHDAWAGYRKAVADRRRLQKQLAYAVDVSGRAQRLYQSKSISLQERQRAELEEVSATEQLAMAEAEVIRAIEELEHIGITIDPQASAEETPATTEQIPVRTPLGGVVLERLVTPGTTVTPGSPMFVVSELSTLWAVAEVDESHLSHLHVDRPVQVSVAAYPGESFPGAISFIGDTVNPTTRRITVRAAIPNREGRLKPEMFATITLGESEPRKALVVPRGAIQTIDSREVVFVEAGPGQFMVRPVTLGPSAQFGVEVVDGLAEAERIVGSGSFVLKSELIKARGSND